MGEKKKKYIYIYIYTEEKHRSNFGKELPWKFRLIFWAKMLIAVYLLWARHGGYMLLVFPKVSQGIAAPYSPAQAPCRVDLIRVNDTNVLAWRPPRSTCWTVSLGVTHAGLCLHSLPLPQVTLNFVNDWTCKPSGKCALSSFISTTWDSPVVLGPNY